MIYQYTVYVKDSKKGSFKKSCWSILKLSYMGRSQGVAYETNKPLLIASAWPCSKVACSFGPACVCHREIPHVTTPQIWKGSKCEPLTLHYGGIDEFGPMVHMHMHVYIYICVYMCLYVYIQYMHETIWDLPGCPNAKSWFRTAPAQGSLDIPRAKWHDVHKSLHLLLVFMLPYSVSGWWFQPSWKILVSGKDYPIYYGK